MEERADVVVIGGGVVGLACANALLDAGRGVTLLERDVVGSGASRGNCGLVTPSHALPLNQPATLVRLFSWIGRADSPVYVRPRLDLSFVAWGVRFARSCGRARMLATLRGRAALLESSRDLFVELVARDGLDCQWEEQGLLEVFLSPEARAAAEPAHRLLGEHGVRVETLSAADLLAREPTLTTDVVGGCHYPRDAQLRPEELVSELARVIREKGARILERCSVRGFELGNGRATAVETDSGSVACGTVLLCTGALAPRLGRVLGLRLPVQPGKGYSITLARREEGPRHPLLLHEANMAVTPWEDGLRLGGTMEFSGYDSRMLPGRLEALREGARRYLADPGPLDGGTEWCGWRPMTPDELPIIDRAPRLSNAFVATGHGMMGVSMAPATARLVRELVTGEEPFLDPGPYTAARFGS